MMDDLLDSLAGSFQVTKSDGHSAAAQHPRFAAYKNKAMPEISQEKRRAEFLQRQKDKRFDRTNKARNLAMDDFADEAEQGVEDMECTEGAKRQERNYYKDQLMLAEWMMEKPDDFESEWIMVLCPEGRRCLVVASRGTTIAYTKSGHRINTFKSQLPGALKHNSGYTLLDCIYSEVDRKYYVLDILSWNQVTIMDSDTECRFFWGLSHISEEEKLAQTSKTNPYPFEVLPRCYCTKENIQKLLGEELPFKSKLDGLLFYVKTAVYWQEVTPLVTWLKPFMLPEILAIDIPEHMKEEKMAAAFRQEYQQTHTHSKYIEKKKGEEEKKEKAMEDSNPVINS